MGRAAKESKTVNKLAINQLCVTILTAVSKEIDVDVIAASNQPQSVTDERCCKPFLADEN
jgi:hypothetical protein